MRNKMWMLGFLMLGLFTMTSCDEDEHIGNYVSGRWFGDMDMYYGNQRAMGSEVEFIPTGWGSKHGRGIELDYYHRGYIRHDFNYQIRDGIIYMTFDDPDLDCAIVDYHIDDYFFRGYIADYYTLENMTYFNLRNYNRYWNEYGYGKYNYGYRYDDYYVKSEKFTEEGEAIEQQQEEPKSIRGVNMKKVKD